MRYESGSIISGASHSGIFIFLLLTGDVEVTGPTFVNGEAPATPGVSLRSSSGPRISCITMGVATVIAPQNGEKMKSMFLLWIL